jgi:membrane associated rhomboid family serine protease
VIPIPLSDENPSSRRPIVTIGIIATNVVFWLYELVHGVQLSALDYGVIPQWMLRRISEGPILLPGGLEARLHQAVGWPFTLFTAMFTHGGWIHIIGNMWFLWIFGDNLEERMGRAKYLLFYLVCGILAAGTQVLATPASVAPMVGASGAIAGVLGGYILLYPTARVRSLWVLIVFVTTVRVPAFVLLGLWFLSQFLTPAASGVAWEAHVGGFLAGLALVKLFMNDSEMPPLEPYRSTIL